MLRRVSYLGERIVLTKVTTVVGTHKSSGESHTWLSETLRINSQESSGESHTWLRETLRINFQESSSESHIWLSETLQAELEFSIDSHGLMRSERVNEPGDDERAQSENRWSRRARLQTCQGSRNPDNIREGQFQRARKQLLFE